MPLNRSNVYTVQGFFAALRMTNSNEFYPTFSIRQRPPRLNCRHEIVYLLDLLGLFEAVFHVVRTSEFGLRLAHSLRARESVLQARMLHDFSQSSFNPRSRIEHIAQPIANKIERENGKHHRGSRKENQVRSVEQM